MAIRLSFIALSVLSLIACAQQKIKEDTVTREEALEKAFAQPLPIPDRKLRDLVDIQLKKPVTLFEAADILTAEKQVPVSFSDKFYRQGAWGEKTAIAGTERFTINHAGRASEVLDKLASQHDVTWSMKSGVATFEPFVEKRFKVDVDPFYVYSYQSFDTTIEPRLRPHMSHGAKFDYVPEAGVITLADRPSRIEKLKQVIIDWEREMQLREVVRDATY